MVAAEWLIVQFFISLVVLIIFKHKMNQKNLVNQHQFNILKLKTLVLLHKNQIQLRQVSLNKFNFEQHNLIEALLIQTPTSFI